MTVLVARPGASPPECDPADPRQIVGINVVGVDVVLWNEGRGCGRDSLEWESVGTGDARNPEPMKPQGSPDSLSMKPPQGPRQCRSTGRGLSHHGALVITIDPGGADIDPPWPSDGRRPDAADLPRLPGTGCQEPASRVL